MEMTPEEIGTAEFRLVRKGYDPDQVRRLLGGLSAQVALLTERAGRGEREAADVVDGARVEADRLLAEAHDSAAVELAQARADVAALLDGLQARLEEAEVASAERVAVAERDAAERAAVLEAATHQAVASMQHQAGEKAERIVAAAADEAGVLVAQAEQEAAHRRRRGVDEARAAADEEKARHRAELDGLVERVLFVRAYLGELEGYVDHQEAVVEQIELRAELHRQRLAATIAGLQDLHDDPGALAGMPRREVRAEAAVPELALLRAAEAHGATDEDEELDIAGELAGVSSDEPRPVLDPDSELVRRFFEEGVYADERWKPRRDRRRKQAEPAEPAATRTGEVPLVSPATMSVTGDDEAITSEPPEEQVSSSRIGSSAPK